MRSITTVVLILSNISLFAQKLPTTQQVSLRVPSNVKIDGKADEWGDKFQAYNTATEIYYTLANDDEKLYLVAQATDDAVINRMINGGIKLMVQKGGIKRDQGSAAVKFPLFEKGKRALFVLNKKGETRPPKELFNLVADSIMKVNNKKLTSSIKWIHTKGIPGVDSLLSIYNEQGINAACGFDNRKIYTCEISIDLKLLGLSLEKSRKFLYHIIINGDPNKFTLPATWTVSGVHGDGSPYTQAEIAETDARTKKLQDILTGTTDFWGEYTLAK